MRVVAGTARGLRLEAPRGDATRPTSDRVREAVFNALGSMHAVVDAVVLDLFAGSGALGTEALSRGARSATFVDSAPGALTAIRANLTRTGLDGRARVVAADVLEWCRSCDDRFGVVLADPPYAFDRWPELLRVVPGDLVVAESNRGVDLPPGWGLVREKTYGTTVVSFVRRQEPAP